MIQIWIALIVFFILFLFPIKEGFEQDSMTLIIESLVSAWKDRRMRPDQKIAIEDALRYATFIKNL